MQARRQRIVGGRAAGRGRAAGGRRASVLAAVSDSPSKQRPHQAVAQAGAERPPRRVGPKAPMLAQLGPWCGGDGGGGEFGADPCDAPMPWLTLASWLAPIPRLAPMTRGERMACADVTPWPSSTAGLSPTPPSEAWLAQMARLASATAWRLHRCYRCYVACGPRLATIAWLARRPHGLRFHGVGRCRGLRGSPWAPVVGAGAAACSDVLRHAVMQLACAGPMR